MNKKKKQQLMEQQAMAEQAKRRAAQPQIIYGGVPGCVPIAPPAKFIQLTPIVQPIAMVPYSTQQQPICTFEDETDDYE